MKQESSWRERSAFLLGWAASVACILWLVVDVHERSGMEGVRELGKYAAYSLFVFGKLVIFAGLDADAPLDPVGFAFMVWAVDCFWAFAIVGGLSQLTKTPLLGRALGRMLVRAHDRAQVVLKEYPKLETMAFWGVSLLVFLPLAATGAVTGSFAAQLVGLPRLVGVGAVAVGSAATGLVFVLLATFVGERAETFLRSPVLAAVSLVVLVLFARLAYVRVRERLR